MDRFEGAKGNIYCPPLKFAQELNILKWLQTTTTTTTTKKLEYYFFYSLKFSMVALVVAKNKTRKIKKEREKNSQIELLSKRVRNNYYNEKHIINNNIIITIELAQR